MRVRRRQRPRLWEWELTDRAETGTVVLFRHYGFADGYAETSLAHTAQSWASGPLSPRLAWG